MSAVQATTSLESTKLADPEASLARQFLYYMSMMREVEDRIERKLYRQRKPEKLHIPLPGPHRQERHTAIPARPPRPVRPHTQQRRLPAARRRRNNRNPALNPAIKSGNQITSENQPRLTLD